MPNTSNSVKPTGIVLITSGLVLLFGQSVGFDPLSGHSFWPLYVIIPGAILLALASFDKSFSTALAPIGMIVTLTGCVLAYQDWASHFQSWAYAWIIVGPFAFGAGLALHGRMHADDDALHDGRRMAALSIPFFVGAAAIFELVFNISGFGLSVDLPWGILLPSSLVALGGVVLLRQSKQK